MSSTPDPEWDDLQQGWMLALDEYEAGLCENCGHHLDDTQPPAAEPEDWEIPPPARCTACTRIAIEHDRFSDQGTKHLHALRWRAIRKG